MPAPCIVFRNLKSVRRIPTRVGKARIYSRGLAMRARPRPRAYMYISLKYDSKLIQCHSRPRETRVCGSNARFVPLFRLCLSLPFDKLPPAGRLRKQSTCVAPPYRNVWLSLRYWSDRKEADVKTRKFLIHVENFTPKLLIHARARACVH